MIEVDLGCTSVTGVASVTGNKVDNTDPKNPIVEDTTKIDLGLENVDNTSDANKPISTATQTALDGKVSPTDYAAFDTGGTLKARLDGTTLYLTNNGTDA